MLKGLYVITDRRFISRDKFSEIVEKVLRGGANVLQLREKDTQRDVIIEIGKELLPVARKYGVPLIINDSPETAREIGADGVHLGEDDPPVSDARKVLGDDAILGVSCYGQLERGLVARDEGADYVVFGTPFYTPTKPDRKPTPFQILRDATRLIREIPVFAIGGINPENAHSVLETGVDGVAVITSVFGSDDPEKAARDLAGFFDDSKV